MLGTQRLGAGGVRPGRRWLGDGIAYAERVERFNDRHYMAAHLAHVQWASGDWAAADAEATRALADGRGGITTRITAAARARVRGARARGEWAAAAAYLHEAARAGRAMGELQRVSPACGDWPRRRCCAATSDAAVEWCERGYAASAPVRDAAYLFPYVVTGVRAYLGWPAT